MSVWVVLRDNLEVKLSVWAGPQMSTGPGAVENGAPVVATGTASPRSFGTNLHVAVVTAKAEGIGLIPGTVYSYDLQVGGKGLRDLKLLQDEAEGARLPGVDASAPLHLALGYELDRLPTFVTPAVVLGDLCLAHASCRRTNAAGPDAMAYLDDIIRDNRMTLPQRPQQLFLTGDQIYADDLGSSLLRQINELGNEILGFTEQLPIARASDGGDTGLTLVDATMEEFPATRRRRLVRTLARFSTSDGTNHLLSYGEFIAMHLLVWSPRLWRPLSKADEVFVSLTEEEIEANTLHDWEAKFGSAENWRAKEEDKFEREVERIEIFRAAVPRVARVLANSATYMIFDDHEVTDDWHLSSSWKSRVITAPLGRTILRNGLMAYTLCQGWGNEPEAFTHEGEAEAPKNELLLEAMEKIGPDQAISDGTKAKVDELLALDKTNGVPKVTFHYSVASPRHMVRVLDARTRRTYRGRTGPPKLLGDSMKSQLPKGPLTDGRELLVVVSAAPIFFVGLIDSLVQPIAAAWFDLSENFKRPAKSGFDGPPITGNEKRDVEGWGADEVAFEEIVAQLATYPKSIVLSGDVHFASSVAMDYWTDHPPKLVARTVQFTSSAARNGAPAGQQTIIRAARFSQQILRGLPTERLGWKKTSPITVPQGQPISNARRIRMRRTPSVVPATGWPAGTSIPDGEEPDFRWRITTLRDGRSRENLTHPQGLQPPLPPFSATDPVGSHNRVAQAHTELALGPSELLRTFVFPTNVGVVRVESSATEQRAIHELWSSDGPASTTGGAFTRHASFLSPEPADTAPQLQVVTDG